MNNNTECLTWQSKGLIVLKYIENTVSEISGFTSATNLYILWGHRKVLFSPTETLLW